jgi:hypothetical protein
MKSGNREIVGSGSIVTHNGDDQVQLDQSGLTFNLIFEQGDGGQPTSTGSGDGSKADLVFKNFENSLGITWYSEVGTVTGRKLFLSLFIQSLGEKPNFSRLISFTFSLEAM